MITNITPPPHTLTHTHNTKALFLEADRKDHFTGQQERAFTLDEVIKPCKCTIISVNTLSF